MLEVGDKVDVYHTTPRGRTTAFLFTGMVDEVNLAEGLHFVVPDGLPHDHGSWVPRWAMVLLQSIADTKQKQLEAYNRAMGILV